MRKTSIVTGGARGIGRAIGLALAKAGHNVALIDMRPDVMADTAREIEARGVEAMPIVADTSDHALAAAKVVEIMARWGRIDVLVNNAAIPQTKRILEITETEWDEGAAVNLKGYFNWSQAAARAMLAGEGGRIICISSTTANNGPSPQAVSRFAYSATKAGVLGLTRGLARELAPRILVNAICPGAVLTERTEEGFKPFMERMEANIPMGRVGTREDIAVVAAFLATAEPLYMTGEIIDVDGGAYIN